MKKRNFKLACMIIAMFLLISATTSIFALEASADDLSTEAAFAVYAGIGENGEPIYIMAAATCCSRPEIAHYKTSHTTNPTNSACFVNWKDYCTKCGAITTGTATASGGCGTWCNLPWWPY